MTVLLSVYQWTQKIMSILCDEFLLISVVIRVDFKRNPSAPNKRSSYASLATSLLALESNINYTSLSFDYQYTVCLRINVTVTKI